MHINKIVHRDLKPENILKINDTYKIADFGSGKLDFKEEKMNTPYVVSRYYRAPELILGLSGYNNTIDIWCKIYFNKNFSIRYYSCGTLIAKSALERQN